MVRQNIKKYLNPGRVIALIGLVLIIVVGAMGPSDAQSVARGYNAQEPLQRGMLVVLKQADPNTVEAATPETIDRLHGIVVNANDAPVTISDEGQQVFVATGGRFDVLVSDQNGTVKVDDYITASSLRGIGMKAGTDQSTIIGKAAGEFNGRDQIVGQDNYEDSKGVKKSVKIGRIPVDISPGRNPLSLLPEANLPGFLKRASQAIAGRPVSPVRVYIAAAIFFISGLIAGSMLYAGTRSSIISIGRNPLSKRTIFRSLLQVTLTSLIVFIVGMFGVYLLLRL